MLEEGSGLTEGQDFHLVFSPERVLTGRVFADLRRTPSWSAASTRRARRGVDVLRGGARLRRAPRPAARQRRVGPGLRRGRRAGQARRDDLPRRQHRPGQPVRALRRHAAASTSTRSSRPATPSRTATSTSPASPSAATASRSTRGSTCGTTRTPPSCARPARPTPRCRSTPSTCWPGAYGDLAGAGVVVLGAAYRGGVKETAFSGVFARSRRSAHAGARRRARPDVQPTRSSPRSASPPYQRASRSTPPSCRPTTPSTRS